MFAAPKSIQATVTILENLHVILEKTPRDDIRSEVLPLLFNAFESTTIQVQVSFESIGLLSDFIYEAFGYNCKLIKCLANIRLPLLCFPSEFAGRIHIYTVVQYGYVCVKCEIFILPRRNCILKIVGDFMHLFTECSVGCCCKCI